MSQDLDPKGTDLKKLHYGNVLYKNIMIKQRDLYQQYPKGMESKSKEMNAKDTTIMHALYDASDFMTDLVDEVMKLQTKHENRSAAASARASRKRQGGDAAGASKRSKMA